MKEQNMRELREELLKELLGSMPQEVLESLEDDLRKAIESKDSELSQEEEFELINRMEGTIIRFIMERGEDLSINGIILLMFKILIGIEDALKDVLSESEFEHYKQSVIHSERLRQQREEELMRMMKENDNQFLGELLNRFKGDFK